MTKLFLRAAESVQKLAVATFVIMGTIMVASWNNLPDLNDPGLISIHSSALTFGRVVLLLAGSSWLLAEVDKRFSMCIPLITLKVGRFLYISGILFAVFYTAVVIWVGPDLLDASFQIGSRTDLQ